MIKLLIVDDEKRTRGGLVKCIPWEAMGIDVIEEAEDGVIALEVASRLQPDIVLCDIRMPRMNGIEFATLLREKLEECKIIFISGYSDKEYLKSAIKLKAVSYLEKPINIGELKAVMQNTIATVLEEREKKKRPTSPGKLLKRAAPSSFSTFRYTSRQAI